VPNFFSRLSEFFYPLLAHLDIRAGVEQPFGLSLRPEPSGRVVRGKVDGLDSGGWQGRRFVLRHTHRPQRRLYPIYTGRSGNVQHQCGGSWAGPRLFLGGSFWECVPVSGIKVQSLVGLSAHCVLTIRPLHRTYVVVVVRKTDELLCGGYKWVSWFETPCSCTRWTGERWVEQVSRLHGTAS